MPTICRIGVVVGVFRVSGKQRVPIQARLPNSAWVTKIQRQENPARIHPPKIGAIIGATAVIVPMVASTRPLSWPAYASLLMASARLDAAAAPAP